MRVSPDGLAPLGTVSMCFLSVSKFFSAKFLFARCSEVVEEAQLAGSQLGLLDGKWARLPDEIMSLNSCLSVQSVYNGLLWACRVLREPFDITTLVTRPAPVWRRHEKGFEQTVLDGDHHPSTIGKRTLLTRVPWVTVRLFSKSSVCSHLR